MPCVTTNKHPHLAASQPHTVGTDGSRRRQTDVPRLVALALITMVSGAAAEPALPTIDDAFPPSLGFDARGAASLYRVSIDLRSAPEVSWIALEVTARRAQPVEVPIDLPVGARVVGMMIRRDGDSIWATAMAEADARAEARTVMQPALLAWASTTAGVDHLTLRVEGPARVDLAVELPAIARLGIVAERQVGRVDVSIDGAPRGSWKALRSRVAIDTAGLAFDPTPRPYPHVDRETSLVAETSANRGVVVDFGPSHPTLQFSVDKTMIRRAIKRRMARLRHCYNHVAQYRPLEGLATLRFRIAEDGHVRDIRVDSELPASITTCLAAEVATLELPAGDGEVEVNYPLQFTMPRP